MLVVYLLQTRVHSGSIDGNIDLNHKSSTILALLSPHTSNCNEYTSLLNSSRNVEVGFLLDQPSRKKSGTKKEVFIKDCQEILDDVLTFVKNVLVFGRF